MMGKRFLPVFFTALSLLLLLFAGTVYAVDPYYHYHGPVNGFPLRLVDGRYQNAGVARNLEYDSLILGTSVSANFETAQFDELYGISSKKLIVLGGYFSDFRAALDLAFETHEVERIFWGIDSNILGRSEEGKDTPLPDYLYNNNPFDDASYLLNKDMFFSDLVALLRMRLQGVTGDEASGGYLWGDTLKWSKELVLASYVRPEEIAKPEPANARLSDTKANLEVILDYVTGHPETEFTFYMVPYNILFWDMTIRNGQLDSTLAMQQYVLEALAPLPNVEVFYFMDRFDVITNMDYYGDHIHFSPEISRQLVAEMAQGEPLREAEIADRLDALRAFVTEYDFEGIFTSS